MSNEPNLDEGPPGEAEMVQKVQHLCWIARMSADSLLEMATADKPDEEMRKYELERYRKFAHNALQVARGITDDFYRDAEMHLLIDLFMSARNEDYAKQLFSVLKIDVIREKVLEAHPQLGATS